MAQADISTWSARETSTILEPSSTLSYLNSQLITYGFVPSPGLQLATLAPKDLERTIRCMLSLLSQRVDDMNRAETLDSKYKTLSYDFERLKGMHREEREKCANAEREKNMFKNRLTGAQRTVEDTEKKCQTTLAELSRTRSALSSVRAAHIVELKRKDKEMERMTERFQKVAGMGSGIRASSLVDEVVPIEVLKEQRKDLLEEQLELAEKELAELKSEREQLQDTFVWATKELNALVATGGEIDAQRCILEPAETLTPILSAIRQRLLAKKPDDAEYSRMQGIIDDMQKEVDSKEALIKKFENHFAAMKLRSVVGPECTEEMAQERARLDLYKLELEEERQANSKSNLELQELRASIEADRLALMDEWEAYMLRSQLKSSNTTNSSQSSTSTSSSSSLTNDAPIAALARSTFHSSSPPRSRKPRQFAAGGRSPNRVYKRRKAMTPGTGIPPPTPTGKISPDTEPVLASAPAGISTPPFSPLPSPPGALSVNGIGFDLSFTEEDTAQLQTPVQKPRHGKLPKHAYSPARPSPLNQMLKMSGISEQGASIDPIPEEGEVTMIADVDLKVLERSSFPPMPERLAQRLASIENTVNGGTGGPAATSVSLPPKGKSKRVKEKESKLPPQGTIAASSSGETLTKSSRTREKGKEKEKENTKASVPAALPTGGPTSIKVGATGGGARRVQVTSSSSTGPVPGAAAAAAGGGGGKGTWR